MKRQFATFRLGDGLFGIDVLLIDEVNRRQDVIPVARAPEFVRGLLNLRGQIVTVIDLGVKFGLGVQEFTRETRCVVLRTSRMLNRFREDGLLDDDTGPDMIGLLVERVEEMVSIEESRIDPAPGIFSNDAGRYVSGVVQMDTGLLNILRVGEIVANREAEATGVVARSRG
jgi:purine-binding chemotaxis protein CheW